MSTPPKRNFTAKTARPTIDTSALYGMDEVVVPPVTPTEPTAQPAPPAAPAAPEDPGLEWVQFSTYLRRNTYLRLKQAEYWEPGFVVRQQIEQVVSELLDKLETANRRLPEEHLRKLLQKNKKLRS
ncbi:hypothetical protein DNI29_22260 [Hymenobacter sediminis]|uniref:hypothetical protein n=1 Tax=Hymenobacter sediminis TaxID=2218621 RepID=UPI000DA65052|nr:hypothetical protein [Hymenobacter sediminis]RPD44124.1 hypothetical protein DNI29_22260 [Hymenobacter sediminis]